MSTVQSTCASKLTHVAKVARSCYKCGAVIQPGEKYRQLRERATSSAEACHAGSYPIRHICAVCA